MYIKVHMYKACKKKMEEEDEIPNARKQMNKRFRKEI